jgi:secretion/DNA translocation related CpaE-like protein
MVVQVGLVGQRADLAVEVVALASQAGASVVSLGVSEVPRAVLGELPEVHVDLVLVDVAAFEGAPFDGVSDLLGGLAGAGGLGGPPLPGEHPAYGVSESRRGARLGGSPLVVLCRPGEGPLAREVAVALGGSHAVELPLAGPWLVAQLAPERGSAVLAVIGAVGGVGASTVAIACAVGAGADCLLVDADPDSPGLDLPLGIEEGAGARWSAIPDTSDPLDPGLLRSALPTVGGVSVVTGTGLAWGVGSGSGQLSAVLGVGRVAFARTVVDAGRGWLPQGLLGPGDPVALVLPATLAGIVAGRRLLEGLAAEHVAVLVRPTEWLPTDEVAEQLGVPVALEVPRLRRAAELADCGDLLSGRTGRVLRSLGEQIWGQLL